MAAPITARTSETLRTISTRRPPSCVSVRRRAPDRRLCCSPMWAPTRGSRNQAKAVTQVTVTMSGATVATWSYDATTKQWDRSTNGHPQTVAVGTALSSGPPVAFTNIIVEMVPYQDAGYIDPAGNPVPDANTVGSGQALILSDGDLAVASWSKPSPSAITTYQASVGSPVRLLRGTTWVMLAPEGAATTSS